MSQTIKTSTNTDPKLASIKLPEKLVRAVRERRCIPFVGAGVSKQADPKFFPNWEQLLTRMIAHFESVGTLRKSEAIELRLLLQKRHHLMVAESLKTQIPRDAYLDFLKRQFDPDNISPSDAHRLLFQLRPRMIITTNYDRLLEDTYAALEHKAISVTYYNQPAQVQNRLNEDRYYDRPFLFKIHGDIEFPSELILAESDYRRLRYNENGYRMLLSSIFLHYTVLLIGFSLGDEEILLHLSAIREALKHETFPDYVLLKAESLTSIEETRFRNDYGLEVVYYPGGNNYSGLTNILQQLVKAASTPP
jgi:hypothetical protein